LPIYRQKCKNGHEFDVYLKLSDYDTPQTCECGAPAKRMIVPTMINCDMQSWDHYVSPASGKLITSYKERREDMKATGCVDYEPSMKKHQQKRLEEDDRKLEAKIDETVDREWEKMPSSKREKVANELRSGAEIKIERL